MSEHTAHLVLFSAALMSVSSTAGVVYLVQWLARSSDHAIKATAEAADSIAISVTRLEALLAHN